MKKTIAVHSMKAAQSKQPDDNFTDNHFAHPGADSVRTNPVLHLHSYGNPTSLVLSSSHSTCRRAPSPDVRARIQCIKVASISMSKHLCAHSVFILRRMAAPSRTLVSQQRFYDEDRTHVA